jgi:hypothetical protein
MTILRAWPIGEYLTRIFKSSQKRHQQFGSDKLMGWGREMNLIKVGLEANRSHLRRELLAHPGRYFAILVIDSRAALCIRTCDNRGENLQSHIVDGLTADSHGNLVSIFEEDLRLFLNRQKRSNRSSDCEKFYQISMTMADRIRLLPGLIDHIISSILTKDRNIIIYPIAWIS